MEREERKAQPVAEKALREAKQALEEKAQMEWALSDNHKHVRITSLSASNTVRPRFAGGAILLLCKDDMEGLLWHREELQSQFHQLKKGMIVFSPVLSYLVESCLEGNSRPRRPCEPIKFSMGWKSRSSGARGGPWK